MSYRNRRIYGLEGLFSKRKRPRSAAAWSAQVRLCSALGFFRKVADSYRSGAPHGHTGISEVPYAAALSKGTQIPIFHKGASPSARNGERPVHAFWIAGRTCAIDHCVCMSQCGIIIVVIKRTCHAQRSVYRSFGESHSQADERPFRHKEGGYGAAWRFGHFRKISGKRGMQWRIFREMT